MGDALGAAAGSISLLLLIGSFFGLALVEAWSPGRRPTLPLRTRWTANLGLQAINAVVLGILAPAALIEALRIGAWQPGMWAAARWGDAPVLVAGVLLLDLYTYGMHRLEHASFPLWRLHAVHHSDHELDASTGLRHHPLEALLVAAGAVLLFACLGLPWWVYPVFSALAIPATVFQHANVRLPARLERILRTVLVTPAMHDVHHSIDARDHGTNFGTIFSVWDRLFGTYRATPVAGAEHVAFGVAPFLDRRWAAPIWGLLLPLRIRREGRDDAAAPRPEPLPATR